MKHSSPKVQWPSTAEGRWLNVDSWQESIIGVPGAIEEKSETAQHPKVV